MSNQPCQLITTTINLRKKPAYPVWWLPKKKKKKRAPISSFCMPFGHQDRADTLTYEPSYLLAESGSDCALQAISQKSGTTQDTKKSGSNACCRCLELGTKNVYKYYLLHIVGVRSYGNGATTTSRKKKKKKKRKAPHVCVWAKHVFDLLTKSAFPPPPPSLSRQGSRDIFQPRTGLPRCFTFFPSTRTLPGRRVRGRLPIGPLFHAVREEHPTILSCTE